MSEKVRPSPTTEGPWPPALAGDDVVAWGHWQGRPCGNCGHAYCDHTNNVFDNTVPCEVCACPMFAEPSSPS